MVSPLDDHLPLDPDLFDVLPSGAVQHPGVDVASCRPEAPADGGIEDDEVRILSGDDAPDTRAQAEQFSADPGGHREDPLRLDRAGTVKQRYRRGGASHLFPWVEPIVAGRAVAPDPYRDPVFPEPHDVRRSGAELRVASRAIVMQKKTQRPVQFEITEQTRDAVAAWIAAAQLKPEQFLFPSRVSASPHLSTRQYSRIVGLWAASIGLDPAAYGTHSLRRTKATLIYRRTRNLRAVQLLLGHTKLESTVRYLGIEVDDALEIAEQTEV